MPLFKSLWVRLRKSPALILLHLAFILIAAGGLTTRMLAKDDMVALHPGMPVEIYGFTLELSEFETVYYPGGTAPRNYCSHLLINGEPRTLAVNKPVEVGDWRLYQSSFTPDGTSIIALRSDRPGTMLTFAGYALFALGGLFWLGRRMRALALLGVVALGANAVPVVRPDVADSLARVSVAYQGRIVPYSTVATDALQKIYGKRSYRGLSAERAILSLTLFASEWNDQPIIKTADGHIAFNDCFDTRGNYLLSNDAAADERVGVILLLRSGAFFSHSDTQLSPLRTEAEIAYNRMPSTLIIFVSLFLASALAFLPLRGRWRHLSPALGWMALALQAGVIALQAWLTGHGPFASTFETLQYVVAVVTLLALLLRGSRGPVLLAAGCVALVCHLQASNPMVTPMMPVLHSPWLSLHVSLVMTSYALFVVVAVMALCGSERRARRLLLPAVYLLGLGIITGSVWANESWGRYWGWDPKETWALITFLLYCIPLHLPRPGRWWYVVPLLSVAMTYFGVNLLPSLHAYS